VVILSEAKNPRVRPPGTFVAVDVSN